MSSGSGYLEQQSHIAIKYSFTVGYVCRTRSLTPDSVQAQCIPPPIGSVEIFALTIQRNTLFFLNLVTQYLIADVKNKQGNFTKGLDELLFTAICKPKGSFDMCAKIADTDVIRLWLDDEWYIPVDSKGLYTGKWAEGSLGVVFQIRRDVKRTRPGDHEIERQALKLPRLLADTHQENAYIVQLAEQELKAALTVADLKGGVGQLLGLRFQGGDGSRIRNTISISSQDPQKKKWDRALLLVNFKKGSRPKFCLTKATDGNAVATLPPDIDCPLKTDSDIQKVLDGSRNTVSGTRRAVFITRTSNNPGQKK